MHTYIIVPKCGIISSLELAVHRVEDVTNVDQVSSFLRSVLSAKIYGYEDTITPLISQACIQVLPKKERKHFNVDNVSVLCVFGRKKIVDWICLSFSILLLTSPPR